MFSVDFNPIAYYQADFLYVPIEGGCWLQRLDIQNVVYYKRKWDIFWGTAQIKPALGKRPCRTSRSPNFVQEESQTARQVPLIGPLQSL
jgi:hypothetical protein